MYSKISEPLSVIGNALKDAAGPVSKPQLKSVVDKIIKAPAELLQQIGDAVSKKSASEDITAGALGRLGAIVGLIAALALAAGAEPAQIGKQIAQADTAKKVETILDSLVQKADMPTLTMKGKIDMNKVMDALNDAAFNVDTRVGPTQGKA
jgi:hypothetical protein